MNSLFFSFSPSQLQLQTHSERAPEDEWLDILPHPVFSPDGDSFMLLAGIQETDSEHFTHIKHVTITQQRVSVISHGRYEVSFFPHFSLIVRSLVFSSHVHFN
jgi:inactive dipeptidyl peptidase 10